MRTIAIPVQHRGWLTLAVASSIGLLGFCWPLILSPSSSLDHDRDAPWLFAALLVLVLAVVIAELSTGGIDAKALAMLGVLATLGAALRPFGGGAAGIEPTLFLLILAGRVLGPGFGFMLGALMFFVSALLTGGVGPWLPFQMFAAAWVGLLAGWFPSFIRGRTEIFMLAGYTAVASLIFGLLTNLWFWPFSLDIAPGLSYVAGASIVDNLQHLVAFSLATSLGFDIPRAALNAGLVIVVGPGVLLALRRAARRAVFANSPKQTR